MSISQERIYYLLDRYFRDNATLEEQKELLALVDNRQVEQMLEEYILNDWNTISSDQTFDYVDWKSMLANVIREEPQYISEDQDVPIVHHVHFFKSPWLRYAAVLLLVAGTAMILGKVYQNPQKQTVQAIPLRPQTDIPPGSDKAILTQANGQKIFLDSTTSEALAEKGIRNRGGVISYSDALPTNKLNTLSTPRGGQYKVQLNDGTMVWLNASSSITYPETFEGNRRTVSITGEVYLEVTKDKARPFVVNAGKEQINVLGTSFNINAYDSESSTKISLLEGSVKVANTVLKPGEAFLDGKVQNTDMDQDLAWKNNLFNFNNMDLSNVMRQLERWYDIEVRYEGKPPQIKFKGKMYRSLGLSDVLESLDKMGVKFERNGKLLIIKG